MTRDDIIRMAREAEWSGIHCVEPSLSINLTEDELERFAALVAEREREACAYILLEYAGRDDLSDSDESLLKHLFDLIRARRET